MTASLWGVDSNGDKIVVVTPDGTIGYTRSFRDAIYSLDPVAGGKIYLPQGNFTYTPFTVTNRNNVTIEGANREASRLLLNAAGDGVVLENCQWWTIKNLYCGINAAPQSFISKGFIFTDGSSNATIEGNNFVGFSTSGLDLTGTALVPLSGHTVKSNYFLGNGERQFNQYYSNDFKVQDNQFGRLAGIDLADFGVYSDQCSQGNYTGNYHWDNGIGFVNNSGNGNTIALNRFEESLYEGYFQNGGQNNLFDLNKIHSNSSAGLGLHDAVYIQNASIQSILGNHSYSFDSRRHRYSINVDTGCSEVSIGRNKLQHYSSSFGPIRIAGDAGSASFTGDFATAGNSVTQVTAGSTVFVGTFGQSATESAVQFLLSGKYTPLRLYVASDVAPGVGQSFTCTLRLQGVGDTAMTTTISGTGTVNAVTSPTPGLVLSPQDALCLKVVASAGAVSARIRFYLVSCEF